VYDEFRDFLIASKLITYWDVEKNLSKELIIRFSEAKSTISEGLQKYLCLWGIKNDQRELLNFLSSSDWFNLVFIRAVFNTPDLNLTDYVVDMVRDLFTSCKYCTLHIIFNLSHRLNLKRYPKLNIQMLFDLLDELNEQDYEKSICEALNEDCDIGTSCISHLCQRLTQLLINGKTSEDNGKKLIILLCYLVGVRDNRFPKYRNFDFGPYPAQDAIIVIAEEIGRRMVSDEVEKVYNTVNIEPVKNNLKEILDRLGSYQ
jgi:hypothetical protein